MKTKKSLFKKKSILFYFDIPQNVKLINYALNSDHPSLEKNSCYERSILITFIRYFNRNSA